MIPDSAAVFWMLVAFVVTFAVTRVITNLIRRGRGPFRDMSVGGVHIHHQVWGIFLLLGVGTMELAYRPVHTDPLTPPEQGGIDPKRIAPKARVY